MAPYGLNAQLTGQHLPDTDTQSIKLLDEWKKFFSLGTMRQEKCPAVVEVTLGEVKMLYPSSLVLVPAQNTKTGKTTVFSEVVRYLKVSVQFGRKKAEILFRNN